MTCGVGCRCGWGPVWLWLWCRPAAAALIQPLAWEPPCAIGVALKKAKQNKTKQNKTKTNKQKKEELAERGEEGRQVGQRSNTCRENNPGFRFSNSSSVWLACNLFPI